MNKLRYILYILMVCVLSACTDETTIFNNGDDAIKAGDAVLFNAQVPRVTTRSPKNDYIKYISNFMAVSDDYVFNVEMWEKGEGDAVKIGSATYNPTKNTVDDVTTYDEYGTLTEESNIMYWPSNVKKYGFHAVSSNSTETIVTETKAGQNFSDQTDEVKFFNQDMIEGYGYVPGWDDETDKQTTRVIDNFNYLTAKEWYAANKAWGNPTDKNGDPITDNALLTEYWKKIPLYMQHKRSRITIRLRAGEGIERDQIKYDEELTPQNISAEIYSYDDDNKQTIVKPLLCSYNCEYKSPDPAPEETVLTACYDAIVNPHDYARENNMTEQKILFINLSGSKFSFYASNDKKYSSDPENTNEDVKTRYNLEAGKHLILDVTLSTDTRKILITAYVVDWEDWPFSSLCDDFGQAADPEPINDKADLIAFLTDPERNKPGNVAVVMPLDFNLIDAVIYTEKMATEENKANLVADSDGKKPGEEGYQKTYKEGYTEKKAGDVKAAAGWDPKDYELKATLKLAGATITTHQRMFDKIAASGSIVNGTVIIADKDNAESPIDCAIATENKGTIERIDVLKGNTTRKATRAGLVITNSGTIYRCRSELPVYNSGGDSEVLIGGIAAVMAFPRDEHGVADESTPVVIDQCNVNARIDGGTNVRGGGIAGSAEGKLTNNTFEYGITLLQPVDQFKNILYAKGTQDLDVRDNEWSTKVGNTLSDGTTTLNNFRPATELYTQVIDSQEELKAMLTGSTYNLKGNRFRVADSFAVNGDGTNAWTLGTQSDELTASNSGNLFCELNCNNKTITLTGTSRAQMLFSNIQNRLYNLTLVVDKPIEAMPNKDGATDAEQITARAPLAYSVTGSDAIISNVKVKMGDGAYIHSSTPAGLVVWAYNKATIADCQSDADVRIALPEATGEQATYFVGGLVCTAAEVTILRCTYQRQSLNASEEAYTVTGKNIFYGGIVGGPNTKDNSIVPSIHIADCTSWLNWESTAEKPHSAWGGIIGSSKYAVNAGTSVNATDGECQGNWWAAPVGASATGLATNMTEEKTIGKKNSVQPIRDTQY
ncbi:MAG: hypothetical protein KBT29_06245 [Prevotellaceae bacterium]|nr:hypothetical protein [Candidatus Minthosoma caballi]